MPPNYPKLAYLVNVYPAPSHSFIRREILALEALGWQVTRYSVRRTESPLHDVNDQRESEKTEVILEAGGLRMVFALFACMLSSPMRFLNAAGMAWKLGRISDSGQMRHAIYLAEACWLCRRLRQRRVEHLHAHFGTNSTTVALLCFLVGGPRFSFTVHGPEEFDSPIALGLSYKVQHAAFAVAISQFGRSQLMRWCEYSDWEKIHVVHCGLDRGFFDSPSTPVPDNQRFVCVGRLCEQKGQLLLVDAFARMRPSFPKVELVLVGDGPMRSQIEANIRSHGIADAVRITGWASGETVMREIADARALVLASFAEGLPVVLMEALAIGRPVISTYVAGIPELVINAKNGWLVPAGDVDAIAYALQTTLETPVDLLQSMGKSGRLQVLTRHCIQTEVEKLGRFIREDKHHVAY